MKIILAGDFSTRACAETLDLDAAKRVTREVVPLFAAADYRILNLENVLCERGVGAPIIKSGPNLWGHPKNVAFLEALGVDLTVLANNHFGDFGEAAAIATLALLDGRGMAHIGGGRNVGEAYRAGYADDGSVRLAFLAVCENEFGCAKESKAGAAGFEMKRLADRIAEEKQGADFVVVIFHGGNEYDPVPSPSTVERYRLLVDLGADAVIAMHTHCMQGYEIYAGKPIVYSMGNFYFPRTGCAKDSAWNYGYLTEMTAERGKPLVIRPIPYRVENEGEYIRVFEGEERAKVLAYLEQISAPISEPEQLARLYDAWCIEVGVGNYATHLRNYADYESAPDTEHGLKKLAAMRNLFTCEAHAALMRNTLSMMLEGRLAEAEAALPELKKLQEMPL